MLSAELKYYLHGPKKGQPVLQKDMDVLSAAIASMEYAGVGVADRYFEWLRPFDRSDPYDDEYHRAFDRQCDADSLCDLSQPIVPGMPMGPWSHEYKRLIYGEPLCNTGADLLGIWMRHRGFPRNVVACIMSFVDIEAWWDSHVVKVS